MTLRSHDDLPAAAAGPEVSWRDGPVHGMYAAAGFAVLFFLVVLARGDSELDHDAPLLTFPVLVGLTVATTRTAWLRTLWGRPFGVAVAAAAGVATTGIVVIGLVMWLGRDLVIPVHGPWSMALVVLGCAATGKLLDRLLPKGSPSGVSAPLGDEEWLMALAGTLRVRATMPEARIAAVTAEARAQATEAGATLHDEFGRPEDYASRFDRDETNHSRRMAWVYTGLALLSAVGSMPPDVDWWAVVLTAVWAAFAAHEWRLVRQGGARRLTPARRPDAPSS